MKGYSMQLNYDLVEKLYYAKQSLTTIGIKKPMTVLVKEAVEKYLPEIADEIDKANGTFLKPDVWVDRRLLNKKIEEV